MSEQITDFDTHSAPGVRLTVAELNAARARNQRLRASVLLAVQDGSSSISDVLERASSEDGKSLKTIPLTELISSQPGWGRRRALKLVAWMREQLDVPDKTKNRDIDIGWLLHGQAYPRRTRVFADAMTRYTRKPPTERYPF